MSKILRKAKKSRKKLMILVILIVMLLGYIIDPLRILATEDKNSTEEINLEANKNGDTTKEYNDIINIENDSIPKADKIESELEENASYFEKTGETGEDNNSIVASSKDNITVNTKNDTHEIRTFLIQFVSGAKEEENGNLVWTPSSSAKGHEFTFRVNYAVSGLKELPAEAIQIKIPKSIIRDRNGKLDDHYEMSLPTIKEYENSDEEDKKEIELVYREDGDYIVVYNPDEVEAGMNGYFEVSYATNSSTFSYKDYDTSNTGLVKDGGTASDPFNAVIAVKSGDDTLANVSDDINIFINTNAKILSTQKRYPNIYREWDSSWMKETPEKSNEYYYLVWEISTNVADATQPYNFKIEDFVTDLTKGTDGKDYEFLGYRLSGEKYFSNKNTQENSTSSGTRYDYVLTRHKISTYADKTYTLKNTETATVDPIDQVDADTTATSSNQFSWDPSFTPPTGHFNMFKYGNNNWYSRFGYHWDYASYDLEKLQNKEVNELKGFKYFTETIGYAYPWTLREGGSSDNPEDYGVNPVSYDTWDDTLYLEGDTNPMSYNDYYLDYFTYEITNQDAVYDNFYKRFNTTSAKYEDNETITFYAKFNGGNEWIQIGTYNLKTKELTKNDEYVREMTTSKITFKEGVHCTGWRFTTSNKHYYTHITVTPWFVLTDNEYVSEKIKDKSSIKIQNNVSTNIKDYKGKMIFEKETWAFDYARVTYYDSGITKNATAASNNKAKRICTITWKVNAWETATSGSGEAEYIRQNSGIFYDLIPIGGEVDLNSIQVQTEIGFLPENEYTYETIPNYRNSGRTMLIVRIKEQANYYTVFYNTVHSWANMLDYGRKVLNPVAYETGNEKITKGFTDNGGNLSTYNKALYNNLDSTTDAKKFIYTEATNNINALTAAVSGLYKKVKNSTESVYLYDTDTEPEGIYSYQMRFQNTFMNKSKNLIFFDSLENFVVKDSKAGTEKSSGWRGTLKSIDLTQIENMGIAPVVYISTKENLDLEENHDLTDTSTWIKVTEKTDLSTAKAIAIDMRKDTEGNEFVLETAKGVTAVMYMQAPENIIDDKNQYTYNNIYLNNTLIDDIGGTEDYFIHQDYTSVKYHVVADVDIIKVNEENEDEKIKGITFRLYGTSNYGTEVDKLVTSDKNGNVKFKNIEAGTYTLQEYEGTPDWLEDHTEHKVEIKNTREVFIDGNLTTKDNPVKIKNTPRIHTDVTFYKKDLVDKNKTLEGVKFKLSGTSNYGNEILKYATSDEDGNVIFEDLEYGTYKLKEIETVEGYILGDDEYKVVVDENGNSDILKVENGISTSTYEKGNYNIYNEPFHSFRIVKRDSYTDKTIAGVKFRLFGTSDYGNIYDEEVESSSIGFVDFENLEAGTYVLQETYVPEVTDEQGNKTTYVLDTNKYAVTVEKNGNVTIDGKEKNENGNFIFKNDRNKGQITITKKWLDDKNNDERPEPTVIISTQKPLEARSAFFRDNYISGNDTYGPLYYVDKNYKAKITGSFSRNEKLSEEEVKKKTGVTRLDREYNNPNAEYKIYGWIEDGNFYWWTNGEVAIMTDSSNKLFYEMGKVKRIDTKGINTSSVTNMESMFSKCSGLTDLDISHFDTSSVTNMFSMFRECSNLTELDLSSFNTSSATNMGIMFFDCSSLKKLDVSNFDTSNVTDMSFMFQKCTGLTELDVSNFDTSNVTDMSYMFSKYSSLKELDVSEFDTSKVTNMEGMFWENSGLTKLDLSSFDTSNVTNMRIMFEQCESLTEIDLSSFNTSSVTNMQAMFYNCNGLTEIDVSNFDTSSVTNMINMFYDCRSLTKLDLSNFDTSSVTTMLGMFYKCNGLIEIDVSNFDTSSVTNMDSMFADCESLTEIDLSNFDTSSVTNMASMFSYCESLTEIDVSNFDTSSVTNMRVMFNDCRSLTELNVSNFDTSNVTNMHAMFDWCAGLTELDVSNFDTRSVTDMGWMFLECKNLTELDLSNFDTSSVTDMSKMFINCNELKTIYVSNKFNTDNLIKSSEMFRYCYSLEGGNGTTYSSSNTDKTYARIDKEGHPGYFTEKIPSTASLNNNEIVKIEKVRLQGKKFMAANTVETDDVLTYSSADDNYDDKGNKIEWVKNGDTWEYTFYVDDPYADWYVWEDPVPNGYKSNYTQFDPGEVKDQKATITNYTPSKENLTKYGDLKITKKLFSRQNDTETELTTKEDNTEFTFTVTLTAPTGRKDEISGTKIFGDYVFKDGVGTIKLRAGESAIITDLPAGTTYKVTEKQLSGYTCFKQSSGNISTNTIKEVIANNYKEVPDSSTPTEPEKNVNITLAKKVTGNSEKDDSYTLEVALDNLKPETTYYLSNNASFVSDRNGSADITVTLKNNESVTVKDIPVGSKYKVYEGAGKYISSYVITDSNNKGLINNSTGSNTKENTALSTATETADEGENITITFTNNKTVTQDLKVAKVVTDKNDKNRYIFTIEFGNMEANSSFNSSVGKVTAEENGKAEITIYLAGGEEAEFYNVPVGTTYRVTELASTAIASYTITDQNGVNKFVKESDANTKAKKALSTDIETVNDGEEATVTFTNDTVNQEPDSVSTSIGVTKEVLKMDGTKFEDCNDTFTFEIKADNKDNPMPTNTSVTVKGNGDASFGTITFDETGTYSYKITEKKGTLEYYDYDETVYSIVYEVTNTEGLLEITKSVKKNGFNSDVIAFANKVSKTDVKVLKQDEDKNSLKDATLQILDLNKNVVDEWVTDGQEHVKKTAPGEYIFHEVKAPHGYYKVEDFNFTVTEDGKILVDSKAVEKIIVTDNLVKGRITLTKTGEVLNEVTLKDKALGDALYAISYVTGTLQDAIFELYAKEDITVNGKVVHKANEKIAEETTGTDGIAIFDNLYLGKYYIIEKQAPEGFEPIKKEIDIVLSYENDEEKVVAIAREVNNDRIKLDLSVTKNAKGNVEQKVKDATYGVYNAETIKNVPENTLLSFAKTDENGYAKFDIDLPRGKYYVKEVEAPEGYILSTEVQEVDFQETKEVNLVFEDDYTKVTIKKTDITTGKDVIGAKLQILDKEGNVVEAYNSEGTEKVKLEWTTEAKIDENGNLVVDENENPVAKEVTFTKLPIGTYTLEEVQAPTQSGYIHAENIEFDVTETGDIQLVEMKDDYTKVTIKKTDTETGKDVIGAKLQILDKEGNVVEAYNSEGTEKVKLEWTTEAKIDENGNLVVDENGNPVAKEVTFTKLPIGDYILHEEKAPEGYEIAKDIEFTINEDGKVEVDGEVVDEVIMMDLKIKEEPKNPDNNKEEEKPNKVIEETNKVIEKPIETIKTGDAMIYAITTLAVASIAFIMVLVIINRASKED